MRGLKLVEPEMRRIVIQQAIHRAEDARYAHRLHGLLLVTGGQSCRQVADLFGADRRTVQRWVKTYERNGLEGLREGARAGRPRALGAQQSGGGGRSAAKPHDVRVERESVGWQAAVGTRGPPLRRALGGAPMPAIVQTAGVSLP